MKRMMVYGLMVGISLILWNGCKKPDKKPMNDTQSADLYGPTDYDANYPSVTPATPTESYAATTSYPTAGPSYADYVSSTSSSGASKPSLNLFQEDTGSAYAPAPGGVLTASSGGRTHTVARKDTLYSLARQYYGDMSRWRDIYNANRNVISDPNLIKVGQVLVIP